MNVYTIEQATDIFTLIIEVNKRMLKGWVPQGGVCVEKGVRHDYYYQAMVKE